MDPIVIKAGTEKSKIEYMFKSLVELTPSRKFGDSSRFPTNTIKFFLKKDSKQEVFMTFKYSGDEKCHVHHYWSSQLTNEEEEDDELVGSMSFTIDRGFITVDELLNPEKLIKMLNNRGPIRKMEFYNQSNNVPVFSFIIKDN